MTGELPPDMEPEAFRAASRRVADWVASYRETVREHPVLAQVEPGEVADRLGAVPPEEPESLDAILADVDRVVLPGITHWNHPGFFAYFSSSSSAPGLLAEFIAAALGANAMLWRTSPAATELEERMVEWLRQLLGLPAAFRGVILDTASMGSFTALLAAREAADLDVRRRGLAARYQVPPLRVYLSEETHSSVEKAAIAAGIGRDNVRRVPTDDRYRMDPVALVRAMDEDRSAGRRPLFACATLGTTSTTSVDPVGDMAPACARYGAWLHVDAAYAGAAALLPEKRELFAGWEEADSVVVNPHKWLFTPLDCSVLFFRRPEVVRRSLSLTPAYLAGEEEGVTNLMDFGLPLGRRFRALKLWFIFRYFGVRRLRERLRAHIRWGGEFAGWLREDSRFRVVAPHPFGTVCFRSTPPADRHDADAWNRELLAAVNREGSVFLSHTVLDGGYSLRLAVGSVHTTRDDVRRAYAVLAETHDRLAAESAAGEGEPPGGRPGGDTTESPTRSSS